MVKTIPATIEAVQYVGSNFNEVQRFIGKDAIVAPMAYASTLMVTFPEKNTTDLYTTQPVTNFSVPANLTIALGEVIIRMQTGELKKLTEETFTALFGAYESH